MGVGSHSVPSSEFALTVLGECEGLSRLSLDRLDLAGVTADGDSNRPTADGTVLNCGVRPTFRIGLDGEG